MGAMSPSNEAMASNLLAQIRASTGLSQAELARRSRVDRSVLNAYEHRRRQPSVAALSQIAGAAGMQLQVGVAQGAGGDEHAGKILAQVLDLAGALPYRPRDELEYPPLIRLRA